MNTQSDSENELNRVLEKIQEIVEKSADGDYIYRGEPEQYQEHPYHGKVSSNLYRALLTDSIMEEGIEEYRKVIESQIGDMEKGTLESAKEYLYEPGSETISDFEILAQLQHYGGKTNLIDFTTDYLIALFFACDRFYHKDGRVILQKRESEDYQSKTPSEAIKRVESQKSVLLQSPKGFINPDVVVIIPKELKVSVLNYLEKHHDISTKKIYKDVHGFIKWLGGYIDPMAEFSKGVSLYCLRFFRPLPKGRLCYNTISLKGVSNGETKNLSLPSLKPNLFSKSSAVRLPKQKCVGSIISTKINSHSGSDSCLKMRPCCLSRRISSPAMPRSVSLTLSSSLGGWRSR